VGKGGKIKVRKGGRVKAVRRVKGREKGERLRVGKGRRVMDGKRGKG